MRRTLISLLALMIMVVAATTSVVDAFSSSSSSFMAVRPRAFLPASLSSSSSSSSLLSMKLYDWKRRQDVISDQACNDVEQYDFTVTTLRSAPGARKRPQRKGRGISAGQGATCGFGMRGQASRKGRPTRPGFEGGQTPLYRRLPKIVGKPTGPGHVKTKYNLIPLEAVLSSASSSLAAAAAGDEGGVICNFESLLEQKMLTKSKYSLHKVVAGKSPLSTTATTTTGPFFTVQAHAFTATARQAIQAAGGTCQVLSRTTHKPVGDEDAAPPPAAATAAEE